DLPYDVWHSQEISRTSVDELGAGPKTHDGMAPEEKARAEAQHRLEQLKTTHARDSIEVLDTVDQDYLYWSGVQDAYRQSERRIAMEQRKMERLQADMTRQQQWENTRHKQLMEQLAGVYVDAERARSNWLKLEVTHGSDMANA